MTRRFLRHDGRVRLRFQVRVIVFLFDLSERAVFSPHGGLATVGRELAEVMIQGCDMARQILALVGNYSCHPLYLENILPGRHDIAPI
eukprot:SAG11_NODE_88_length_17244_cov_17.187460_2_plen_88_part_00